MSSEPQQKHSDTCWQTKLPEFTLNLYRKPKVKHGGLSEFKTQMIVSISAMFSIHIEALGLSFMI